MQRCGSAQLNASFEYGGAGQSHWGDYFVFTNHGRTCVLAGYARVSARTARSGWMPLPATEAVGYFPAPKSTGPLAQGDSARILLQGSDPSAYDIRDARAPGEFACPKGQPPPRGYRAFRFLLAGERLPIEIAVPKLVGGCDLTISPFGE